MQNMALFDKMIIILFKGKKDWQKSKDRFDQVSRKLHMNHNEYFLSLRLLNEHQNHKVLHLMPHLLDSIQDLENHYLNLW